MGKSYFLHCPKTGGRYVTENVVNVFRPDLASKNIAPSQYLAFGHNAWKPVIDNPDMFIFSIFREPIKRIVSHYVYFYTDHRAELCTKEKMFAALEADVLDSKRIVNYQSQFILDDSGEFYGTPSTPITLDKDLLFQRLSRIDMPIRTESLSKEVCNNILLKIYDVAGVTPVDTSLLPHVQKPEYTSELSKNLYESLTAKEKERLLELNYMDAEVYESIK